jgi:nitrogen fixation protein NifX
MSLRRLLRIVGSEPLPNTEAQAVRAAFATTDMKHVDQHFGTAQRYAVYCVLPRDATLLYSAQFGPQDRDGGEGKLAARIALLEGCALIYCEAIGGAAIRRLAARGICPMRVASGALISTLLMELQRSLGQEFTTWRKRLPAMPERRDKARFDAMEAEGWVE